MLFSLVFRQALGGFRDKNMSGINNQACEKWKEVAALFKDESEKKSD
jgi:hypothetical protein